MAYSNPDMQPAVLLEEQFGPGTPSELVRVPGRVNLIGEHIDYHNLPVLPIAIQRSIRVAFRRREDRRVRMASRVFGSREFEWLPKLAPSASGDWANYVKAAAQAVGEHWGVGQGIDAAVVADLPPAAGLSSSSALLTACTLALLRANGIEASFDELMAVLPEAEYFVGTRGGGMDHAAVLACRRDHALLVRFAPVRVSPVPIPRGWRFLVAHSMTMAEKSGGVREAFNARRAAGGAALRRLGLTSYAEAEQSTATASLTEDERIAFDHVTSEAARVEAATIAMLNGDAALLGHLLSESHASLRRLGVSSPALNRLVETATQCGALGARLTGAGFGGCAIVFCLEETIEKVRQALIERFYSGQQQFDPNVHLIQAEPSAGALFE